MEDSRVSPIRDCFNDKIAALEMRDNVKKKLCADTLKQLKNGYGKRISVHFRQNTLRATRQRRWLDMPLAQNLRTEYQLQKSYCVHSSFSLSIVVLLRLWLHFIVYSFVYTLTILYTLYYQQKTHPTNRKRNSTRLQLYQNYRS